MCEQAESTIREQQPKSTERAARILVVEADEAKREWLQTRLERAGWHVKATENTRDAFVIWVGSREPFDLLLIDPQTTGDGALALWGRLAFLQRGLRVLLPIIPPEVFGDDLSDRNAVVELVKEVEAALHARPDSLR